MGRTRGTVGPTLSLADSAHNRLRRGASWRLARYLHRSAFGLAIGLLLPRRLAADAVPGRSRRVEITALLRPAVRLRHAAAPLGDGALPLTAPRRARSARSGDSRGAFVAHARARGPFGAAGGCARASPRAYGPFSAACCAARSKAARRRERATRPRGLGSARRPPPAAEPQQAHAAARTFVSHCTPCTTGPARGRADNMSPDEGNARHSASRPASPRCSRAA